jgi:transposase-like protein
VKLPWATYQDSLFWQDLFEDLKERGLRCIKLIVSDGHKGIQKAVRICSFQKNTGRIRTTNMIEITNKEIKRRSKVVGHFPTRNEY